MRTFTALLACLCLGPIAGACSAPTRTAAGDPRPAGQNATVDDGARPERMLRAVLRLTSSGLEVVSLVEAPNTVNRRDPLRRSPAFWRSFDGQGRLLEERGVRLETELRSEAPGPDGLIEGAHVSLDEPVFDATVPLRPGLRTVRVFRAAPGTGRDRAELLGEFEVPDRTTP